MFQRYESTKWKKLPLFFAAVTGFNMPYDIAKILLEVDLGDAMVLPVRILLADRKTEVFAERRYHQMPRVNVFEALDAEKSPCLERSGYSREPKKRIVPINRKIEDDEIVLDPRALNAPAIWHDKTLMNSLFYSDEAVQALRAAGDGHYFQFVRCPIVSVN